MIDVAIIGAGPAGYNGAIKAAKLGLSVALIEKDNLGGTCLNRGCIPTKCLIKSAELVKAFKSSEIFGITSTNTEYSLEKIYQRKTEVVEKLRKGVDFLMKKNSIQVFTGEASFVDKNTLKITSTNGEQILSAKNIIIATGSSPAKINIPGAEFALNSEDVLSKPVSAKNIVIIGGGVIGVEYACFFSYLGVSVTIIEAEQRILPSLDRDVSNHLNMQLKKQGVKIIAGAKVSKITDEGKKVFVNKEDNETIIDTEAVVISIGRIANCSTLALENAGVECNRRITTDKNLRTNIPNIYAVGDVSSAIQLAHYAEAEALTAVEVIAGVTPTIDLSVVPSCIYTVIEIATVGNTDTNENTIVGKAIMGANGKANIEDKISGFVKTVFDKNTHELLGAVIMNSRATDMIGELALALSNKLTAEDIVKTIHPHPTLSEAIRLSAEEAIS